MIYIRQTPSLTQKQLYILAIDCRDIVIESDRELMLGPRVNNPNVQLSRVSLLCTIKVGLHEQY